MSIMSCVFLSLYLPLRYCSILCLMVLANCVSSPWSSKIELLNIACPGLASQETHFHISLLNTHLWIQPEGLVTFSLLPVHQCPVRMGWDVGVSLERSLAVAFCCSGILSTMACLDPHLVVHCLEGVFKLNFCSQMDYPLWGTPAFLHLIPILLELLSVHGWYFVLYGLQAWTPFGDTLLSNWILCLKWIVRLI